jgi:hypothetical protein
MAVLEVVVVDEITELAAVAHQDKEIMEVDQLQQQVLIQMRVEVEVELVLLAETQQVRQGE